MIGLLKKDLLILRRVYMKNFFLVLVLYTVLGIALKMTSFFTLMSWMYGFYVVSLFSVDNACRWDFYAATLPVSRKAVVTAKFLLLGLCVAASLFGIVVVHCLYVAEDILFARKPVAAARKRQREQHGSHDRTNDCNNFFHVMLP